MKKNLVGFSFFHSNKKDIDMCVLHVTGKAQGVSGLACENLVFTEKFDNYKFLKDNLTEKNLNSVIDIQYNSKGFVDEIIL